MLKKFFALLVTASLCFVGGIGCGDDTTEKKDTKKPTEKSTEKPTEKSTEK